MRFGVFLALTFALCAGFDLLFPGLAMHENWLCPLPRFTWLSWPGFLLGLVESFAYRCLTRRVHTAVPSHRRSWRAEPLHGRRDDRLVRQASRRETPAGQESRCQRPEDRHQHRIYATG